MHYVTSSAQTVSLGNHHTYGLRVLLPHVGLCAWLPTRRALIADPHEPSA